ncbi:hypothetical protein [Halolamina salifodinae]|uniref:Uncharacterized protein n=1 Tax=Halolamina salifodinae TaxID=1202767 RepID=A0A8T4GVS1_9EURY|nr:hypothetical protein [Halolamina salifodinae]MBP1986999.1 hypothetical protein [Halolamina salifodinae]
MIDKIKTRLGGHESSRIVQALTVFAVLGLIMQIFAGAALAGSADGLVVNDPTYKQAEDTWTTTATVQNLTATSGEQVTVTINNTDEAGEIDLTNTTASVGDAYASVNNVNRTKDGKLVVTIDITSNTSGTAMEVSLSSIQFSDSGTADVTTGGAVSSYTDTFAYQQEKGTFAVGNITTSDGTSFSNLSGERLIIEDSSGTEVVNTTNFSDTYSKQLVSGENYTVRLHADHYNTVSKTVSISYNTTSTVDFAFQRTQVDYDFEVVEDGEPLDSFDLKVYQGTIGDNETAIQSYSVNSNQDNTVGVSNLDDGKSYTVEVVYDNGTTFTYQVAADLSDEESTDADSAVDETIDVTGDNSYVFGGGDTSTYGTYFVYIVVGGLLGFAFIIGIIAMLSGGAGRALGRP